MKYCLACLFLFVGLLLHSSGKDFRVYAPASKSNTLWIILVKSNESGDAVQMEIEQKVDLGFAGLRSCGISAALCGDFRQKS